MCKTPKSPETPPPPPVLPEAPVMADVATSQGGGRQRQLQQSQGRSGTLLAGASLFAGGRPTLLSGKQ